MSPLPRTPRLHIDTTRIVAAMVTRDRSELVGGIVLALVGLFLIPLGPALMGSITWALSAHRHGGQGSLWFKHVAVCSLFIVPLGFYMARRGTSTAIDEAAEG